MTCTLRKREWQFSRRINFAKQNISNGVSSLFSSIPLSQYSGYFFFYIGYGKWFTGYQNHNNRFACRAYGTDELFLRSC